MQSDPLAQLHDILLPQAVSWWPLAWGWWLLLALITGAAMFGVFFWRRKQQRERYRQLAIQELQILTEAFHAQADAAVYLQQLSILLRRTAISAQPHAFPVELKGMAWLRWLDEYCPATRAGFSEGPGRVLLTGPYEPNPQIDADALHALALLWLQQHRNQWQRHAVPVNIGGSKSHA